MLPAPLRRIRSVLGARLHLLQVQYEAAARAVELRPSIDRLEAAVEEWRTTESEQLLAQRQETAELGAAIGELEEIQTKQLRLSRAGYDDLGRLREKLIALRRSDGYAATFENRHPLVSVPIATFNAAEVLVDRAIASVRAQTYDRWEIVVVGDGCTDDTAARVARLDDRRIRFVNLPFRTTVFPPGRHERWQISGVAPWNRAIELSQGEWLLRSTMTTSSSRTTWRLCSTSPSSAGRSMRTGSSRWPLNPVPGSTSSRSHPKWGRSACSRLSTCVG